MVTEESDPACGDHDQEPLQPLFKIKFEDIQKWGKWAFDWTLWLLGFPLLLNGMVLLPTLFQILNLRYVSYPLTESIHFLKARRKPRSFVYLTSMM